MEYIVTRFYRHSPVGAYVQQYLVADRFGIVTCTQDRERCTKFEHFSEADGNREIAKSKLVWAHGSEWYVTVD